MTTMSPARGEIAANAVPVDPNCAPGGAGTGARVSLCVALSVPEDSELNLWYTQKAKRDPRTVMPFVMAFLDGAYIAIERQARAGGLPRATNEDHHRYAPSYLQIKNFLAGDCDFDERVAQRAAFDAIERGNYWRRERLLKEGRTFDAQRELGWI